MTKEEFVKWAKGRGWSEDKWGHLQKTVDNKRYRFKVSSTAVRYETWLEANKEWIRLASNYFKYLSVGEDNKLKGLTRKI